MVFLRNIKQKKPIIWVTGLPAYTKVADYDL
jgi:hypothetical protein